MGYIGGWGEQKFPLCVGHGKQVVLVYLKLILIPS